VAGHGVHAALGGQSLPLQQQFPAPGAVTAGGGRQDQAPDPVGMKDPDQLSDAATHGVAEDVGRLHPFGVEDGDGVVGQLGEGVRAGRLARPPYATVVHGDAAVAEAEHKVLARPHTPVGAQARDQEKGLAVAFSPGLVVDLDPVPADGFSHRHLLDLAGREISGPDINGALPRYDQM
jgi:hypothetical protein